MNKTDHRGLMARFSVYSKGRKNQMDSLLQAGAFFHSLNN